MITALKGLLNSIRKSHNKLIRSIRFQEKPILEDREWMTYIRDVDVVTELVISNLDSRVQAIFAGHLNCTLETTTTSLFTLSLTSEKSRNPAWKKQQGQKGKWAPEGCYTV